MAHDRRRRVGLITTPTFRQRRSEELAAFVRRDLPALLACADVLTTNGTFEAIAPMLAAAGTATPDVRSKAGVTLQPFA